MASTKSPLDQPNQITYVNEKGRDNATEVYAFIGEVPPCPICEGYGEYETGHGPAGCGPCNSRLIPFINWKGERDYVDWGDTIERKEDGRLVVHKGNRMGGEGPGRRTRSRP